MKLIQRFLTRNPCYTSNVYKADSRYTTFQQRGPLGLMLHSVGCAQPSAMVFITNWDKETYNSACVHGFIDANDGTVYQTLPWNYRGWHGAGSSNDTHIGVEMCESKYIKYSGVGANFTIIDKAKAQADCTRTYKAAVELFAMLCKQWNLDPMKDIVSHNEGGKMGIASGHVDPEHYWSGLGMPYTMNGFRADVKAAMNPKPTFENPFKDVVKGKFYYDHVLWCAEHGIVNGKSEDTFAPNDNATRGEIATMLHRFAEYLGKD